MAESKMFSWAKREITVYCGQLQETITSLIKETSGDGEKDMVLADYQEKCVNICKDVDDLSLGLISEAVLCKLLQTIAQFVLDLTFVEESKLIDQEFSQKSSFCRVRNIIETLQSVEEIANHVIQNKSCLEHGIKFLTSMLCTRSSPKWLTSKLFNLVENDSDPDIDDEANILFAQGILSDTHLLALMYCGEMCYWHTKLNSLIEVSAKIKEPESDEIEINRDSVIALEGNLYKGYFKIDKSTLFDTFFDNESLASNIGESKVNLSACVSVTEQFSTALSVATTSRGVSKASDIKNKIDYARLGQLCLENYVRAAKEPMVIGGWNTTRAEEILQYFYDLKW